MPGRRGEVWWNPIGQCPCGELSLLSALCRSSHSSRHIARPIADQQNTPRLPCAPDSLAAPLPGVFIGPHTPLSVPTGASDIGACADHLKNSRKRRRRLRRRRRPAARCLLGQLGPHLRRLTSCCWRSDLVCTANLPSLCCSATCAAALLVNHICAAPAPPLTRAAAIMPGFNVARWVPLAPGCRRHRLSLAFLACAPPRTHPRLGQHNHAPPPRRWFIEGEVDWEAWGESLGRWGPVIAGVLFGAGGSLGGGGSAGRTWVPAGCGKAAGGIPKCLPGTTICCMVWRPPLHPQPPHLPRCPRQAGGAGRTRWFTSTLCWARPTLGSTTGPASVRVEGRAAGAGERACPVWAHLWPAC